MCSHLRRIWLSLFDYFLHWGRRVWGLWDNWWVSCTPNLGLLLTVCRRETKNSGCLGVVLLNMALVWGEWKYGCFMLPCHSILPSGLDGTWAVLWCCPALRMDAGRTQIPSVPVGDHLQAMALQLQWWQWPRQRSLLSLQLQTEQLMCGREEDLLSQGLCGWFLRTWIRHRSLRIWNLRKFAEVINSSQNIVAFQDHLKGNSAN